MMSYYPLPSNIQYNFSEGNNYRNIYDLTQDMLEDKRLYLKPNAYAAVKKHMKRWKEFLLLKKLNQKPVGEITQQDVLSYRKWLLSKEISNRTANNYIDDLRTLFNYLIEQKGLLEKSPLKSISDLPSHSETHVCYTSDEMRVIVDYLREKESILLFYIGFVAFVYLRCGETRQIQVKHIDFENWRIILPANNDKNGKRKWKIIPDAFKEEFIKHKLEEYPKDYYVFGRGGRPGKKPAGKDFFSDRFRPIKKKLGLTPLHTIYGFRHTTVSQLIRAGFNWHKIMKVTGHVTMSSFEKYARSLQAEPIEDLSDGFSVKI